MLKNIEFNNSINWITLKFRDPEKELLYSESRTENLMCIGWGKIMIILATLATSGIFSYIAFRFYNEGDRELATMIIIDIALMNIAWIGEFSIHYFRPLSSLGGFIFIIFHSYVQIDLARVSYISFSPGLISCFLMMLYVGIFYSKNWLMATLAQFIGYLEITIMSFINLAPKMDAKSMATFELSLYIGLFVAAFIYYYVEYKNRMHAFANQQKDNVLIFLV